MATNVMGEVAERERNKRWLYNRFDHFLPVALECAGEESTDQALHVVTVTGAIVLACFAGVS